MMAGWLAQLSTGIKTIAVVAVVPHGVVQLGSFNSISEDLNLVKHIRHTMVKLHENIPGYYSSLDLLESHNAKSLQLLNENFASKEGESNHTNKCDPCLNFSAGCELHEALGRKFKQQKAEIVVQIPDNTTFNSNLTTVNSCAEHLLEAVVAKACRKATQVKHEDTIWGSVKSLLTFDKVFEPPTNDTHAISSADYSLQQSSIVEENTDYYIPTSGARDGRCPEGLSSASYSKCNKQMERPDELHTISRRKDKYGKQCRRAGQGTDN